jgi:hypothetical protein
MSLNTRKGFKFKVKAPSDTSSSQLKGNSSLSYDEVVDESNVTPTVLGRKHRRDLADERDSSRTTDATKISSAGKYSVSKRRKSETGEMSAVKNEAGKKAQYPIIDLDVTKIGKIVKKGRSNKENSDTHKNVLCSLVTDVCDLEIEGIRASKIESIVGRDAILASLESILKRLPHEIDAHVADKAVFHVEKTTDDNTLNKWLEVLTSLEMQKVTLTEYETNIDKLEEDYGIWLKALPSQEDVVVTCPANVRIDITLLTSLFSPPPHRILFYTFSWPIFPSLPDQVACSAV